MASSIFMVQRYVIPTIVATNVFDPAGIGEFV
jgi:hypothetical protein